MKPAVPIKSRVNAALIWAVIFWAVQYTIVVASSIGLLFTLVANHDLRALRRYIQSEEFLGIISAAGFLWTLIHSGWSRVRSFFVKKEPA